IAIVTATGTFWQAWQQLTARPAYSPPFAPTWYSTAFGAVIWVVIAVAAGRYLHYRWQLSRRGALPRPRPWHRRREVRNAICLAGAILLLELPIALAEMAAARMATVRSYPRHFWWSTPVEGVSAALIGAAILIYDRRRARREQR